ncbi:hypothetical protein DBR32_00150 [Taibaiella sp. KBW10]|uniref:DUF4476 domain-containing protein n=1 Tax=Taibaiella sp. KBW10 TaxID=2153357 RepID=UPI000F5AF3AE|nr:DUF4476 domain-containing protein [Taibaiella sp. KBW10]RQO32063.1 hypothetical protein DBR32_00150 [Taibaiella sp. KBW10]
MKRTLLTLATLLLYSCSLMAQSGQNNNNNRPPQSNQTGDRGYRENQNDRNNNNRPPQNNQNNDRYSWETQNGVRGCNGNCLCGGQPYSAYQRVMNDADFRDALLEINKQSFDKDRLRMAQFIIGNNFLSSAQVTQLAERFSFEDAKIELLKNAYQNCVDKGVYFKAVNTLNFGTSKDKVWDYINNYRPTR